MNGHPELELEVLPAAGAVVKSRVLATENHFYQVTAHVPQFRATWRTCRSTSTRFNWRFKWRSRRVNRILAR